MIVVMIMWMTLIMKRLMNNISIDDNMNDYNNRETEMSTKENWISVPMNKFNAHQKHYSDVIVGTVAYQITSLTIVY